MDKKGQALGGIFLFFLGVIVVVALLPSIAQNTEVIENKQSLINQSVDISSTGNGSDFDTAINLSTAATTWYSSSTANENITTWYGENCPVESVTCVNITGAAMDCGVHSAKAQIYMNNTDVNRNATGLGAQNTTYVTITWCNEGYGSTAGTRAMAGLILVFAGLGLLGFAIFYGIRGIKNIL